MRLDGPLKRHRTPSPTNRNHAAAGSRSHLRPRSRAYGLNNASSVADGRPGGFDVNLLRHHKVLCVDWGHRQNRKTWHRNLIPSRPCGSGRSPLDNLLRSQLQHLCRKIGGKGVGSRPASSRSCASMPGGRRVLVMPRHDLQRLSCDTGHGLFSHFGRREVAAPPVGPVLQQPPQSDCRAGVTTARPKPRVQARATIHRLSSTREGSVVGQRRPRVGRPRAPAAHLAIHRQGHVRLCE
jgi:hypothetical protein